MSDGRSPGIAARGARIALLLAVVASTWPWWHRLDDYPPWLDYDSATLGIFVNNVSFHDDYAHGFRQSASSQAAVRVVEGDGGRTVLYTVASALPVALDPYRAAWAAHFLPASITLSALQRALSLPPDRVAALLEGAALALAAVGLAAVAAVALRRRRASPQEALFLAGLLSSMPAFLLYLRTTQPHFLFSFAAFWVAVAAIDRYLDGGSVRALVVLSLTMALYLLVPYVPIVVLPLTGLLLAVARGRVGACLRDPRLFAAAAAAALLAAGLQWSVATAHEPSWASWKESAARFVELRARSAWPGHPFDSDLLAERATKLWHQHFVHRLDGLGDDSRDDSMWTLPQAHPVWLLLLPLVLYGAFGAWRRRDEGSAVFAAVLLPSYALALTVGMPEGRYLLTAVPALAWFALLGLREATRSPRAPDLLLATVLAAMTVCSAALVRGPYERSCVENEGAMAGMREALATIRDLHGQEYGRTRDVHLHWPELRRHAELYLQMLGNMRVRSVGRDTDLASLPAGEPVFAAFDASDTRSVALWERRGFREAATLVDGPTGRKLRLLRLSR